VKKILLFLSILLFSLPSFALETPWQATKNNEGQMRLISAGYDDQGKIISGLEIKLKDGWDTYWANSGDAGMVPDIQYAATPNVKASQNFFPAPHRSIYYDLESWGYRNHVILPISTEVLDGTQPAIIGVHVKWAVCNDNCIPVDNEFSLEVPGGYKDDAVLKNIDEFILQVPQPVSDVSAVKLYNISLDKNVLKAEFVSPVPFSDDVDMFITDPSKNFRYPKPVVVFSDDKKYVSLATTFEKRLDSDSINGKTLTITLRNGSEAFVTDYIVPAPQTPEIQQAVPQGVEPVAVKPGTDPDNPQVVIAENGEKTSPVLPKISLGQAIIAALIGGLILNVMPCVLPVLLLKIFGVVKHRNSSKKYIRSSFVYTIAGILFSFVLLATFVVTLKALGSTIGWGIQFQQPVFLVFMSILITLFAANQWGWFEVHLPAKISEKLHGKLDKTDSTPFGNFLTGAFATLLATPCTAPFLTAAVSFAFTESVEKIYIIFFFIGIGLAVPYILVFISPALVKIFPKPGKWMVWVKHILGVLLFLTNFWIFYIMLANTGASSAIILAVSIFFMVIFLFIAKRLKLDRKRAVATTIYMVIVTFVFTLYLANIEKEPDYMKDVWVKFDEPKINELVGSGKVVFVDVTADWCLTCKFNKAKVVNPMKDYFMQSGVVLMKADFTRPSKEISDYLTANGRYGIPFNKVYGPGAKEGIVLPEILTEQDVKDAVNKAGK